MTSSSSSKPRHHPDLFTSRLAVQTPVAKLTIVPVILSARPDRSLGVPNGLVCEEGQVVDGPGADEAHGYLVAGFAEKALSGPEHDRVDHQAQLIDQVVLHQRVPELEASRDDDFPVYLLLQLGGVVYHVSF